MRPANEGQGNHAIVRTSFKKDFLKKNQLVWFVEAFLIKIPKYVSI